MSPGKVFAALTACLATGLLRPPTMLACAACFGASDSKLAHGMNMGILSLLVVVVGVLGGIAGFFVYVAKRSARLADSPASADFPSAAEAQPSSFGRDSSPALEFLAAGKSGLDGVSPHQNSHRELIESDP